jgi:hypothetical protein
MPIPSPEPGLVISYAYLWHHEHEAGREEGRKDRPSVIVLAVERPEKVPLNFRRSLSAAFPIVFSSFGMCVALLIYRSPGHQCDGGSLAEILFGRSANRWLRL